MAAPAIPAARAWNVHVLRQELEVELDGEVRFDEASRALYATDASVYQILPLGVVIPRSRQDVVRAVGACRRHGVALTMRGGGTSQAGQAIGAGVVVDTSKYLNRLLDVDVTARRARVEPGLVLDELNAALVPHGLRFAPDISTASRATLGGMMANNSSGARSVLYGKTVDHVIDITAVLSDGSVARFEALDEAGFEAASKGDSLSATCHRESRRIAMEVAPEIARRYPKVLRRVGGYNLDELVRPDMPFNLARLIVGSEGTLAVIVEATVSLVRLPTARAVLVVQFDSLLEALDATPPILRHMPSAIEVMDGFILDHTRQSPELHRLRQTFIDGDPAAILCIELYGDAEDELVARLDALERDLAGRGLGSRVHRALDARAQRTIWSLREAALGLSMAMKGDAKSLSFVEDTAVAPDRLREYIARLLALVERHGTTAGVYAHASVGCLHVRPVIDLKTDAGVRRFEALASDVADLVLEFGGALSGEHGDGLVRSPFVARMFGPALYDAFRRIKQTFDPAGILNPGKIVDAGPIAANLRYGPAYRTQSPRTYFDATEYGGLAGAVEMCSGLGVCRRTLSGTMCPSYMATREERHSTRGRANVLRLAMAGEIGSAGLADAAVREAMDLCLECRACKAECPVGVDVARFKSEFLAAYWQRHGTPLQARLLGHVNDVSRWGSRLAPVSNAAVRSRPGRWLAERLAGIDSRRVPPAWTRRSLTSHARARRHRSPALRRRAPRGKAAIFVDTFTNYYHPDVGIAGWDVLDAVGLDVTLAPNGCCGRPLISAGLLGAARRKAAANATRLLPIVEAGRTLVFFEPSCLSAVVEDAPALLTGADRQRASTVARHAVLFEELVAEHVDRIGTDVPLRAGPDRIVVHGHCHQKSLGRLSATLAVLGKVPGAEVVDIDAGCCGMAGSFGLVRGHVEISRTIGERRLLPAARALGPDAVLVAPGTSCRHQVAELAGVEAVHPAALMRALLMED